MLLLLVLEILTSAWDMGLPHSADVTDVTMSTGSDVTRSRALSRAF